MLKELKVKIKNLPALENKLKEIGAKFDSELNATDTYFKQDTGLVLKTVEDERGNFLSILEAEKGTFVIKERTKLEDINSKKEELSKKFGIHRILKKVRKIYNYKEFKIDLNLIEDVGDFLILVGENPISNIIENDLGLTNPEYVRVPFSEL